MAQTNLVQNGTFSMPNSSTSFQFGTYGPYTPTETLSGGWASTGYNFVFLPSSAVATGYYGNLSLWSQTNGAANGFNNAGPGGSNFMAADSDYGSGTAPVTQTINGLVVGKTYAVSFAWAGAQQSGFTGATTDSFQVSLGGGAAQSTQTVSLPSQGFSGWMNQTFNYVATSTSEVLSFLAVGSPAIPPFALLANVSVTQVPEPPTLPVMLTAIAGLLGLAWQRHRPAGAARRRG